MNKLKYLAIGMLIGAFALPFQWIGEPVQLAIGQTVTVDSTQSPIVVNAVADLADLTPSDGQSVIIKTGTEKGLWYYDKDSVAVVDSVAVLTGPGSVGRFLVINNDAGSIAAATAITAAQIDNDVDLEFGVFDADSPRSLTLAELKKTANVVTVANVAALYALDYAIDNQLYQTLGYTTEGIGENIYRYDAGSSAAPDDGLTIDGIGGDGTGTGTGRFIALDQTRVDVTQFGAIPNDDVDDNDEFQAALDAAAGLNATAGFGGECYVPAGNFDLTAITIPQRVKFIGAGRRTTALIFDSSTSGPLIDVWSGSTTRMYDVKISGFEIRTYRGATAKIALRVISAEDCIFEHLTIRMDQDSTANDDIGIVFSGQENNVFSNMRIHAPTPIKIYGDADSQYGSETQPDNTVFRDMVLMANPDTVSNVHAGIWAHDTGLSNISFAGTGAVVFGDHLIYWTKPSSTGTQGFVMGGWRHEQARDPAKYSIHIDMNTTYSNEAIVFTGTRTAVGCGGIYARGARISFVGGTISTNGTATAQSIDAEDSVVNIINGLGGGGSASRSQTYGDNAIANLILPQAGSLNTSKFDPYQSIQTMPSMSGESQKPGAIFGTPVYSRRFTIPVGKRQRQSCNQGTAGIKSGVAMVSVASKQNNIFEFGIVGLGDGNVQASSRGTYLLDNSPNFSCTVNSATDFNMWTGDANCATVYLQNLLSLISVTVTADNTTDTITSAGHGLSDGDLVFISSTGTLPTGFTANTDYYVVTSATDTFQLSETSGGAAVDFTTDGTATITVMECAEGMIWVFMDSANPGGNGYRQRDWIN